MSNEVLKYESTLVVGTLTVQHKASTPLADYVLASLEIEPGKDAVEKFEVAGNRRLVVIAIREKNAGKTPRQITYQFSDGDKPKYTLMNESEVLLENAIAGFNVLDEKGQGFVKIANSSKEQAEADAELKKQQAALETAKKDVAAAKPEALAKAQEALVTAQKNFDQAKTRKDAADQPAIVDIFLGYRAADGSPRTDVVAEKPDGGKEIKEEDKKIEEQQQAKGNA